MASTLKPLLVGRYLLVGSPALALLAAAILVRFQPRWIAAAAAIALLAVSARQIYVWYHTVLQNWRGAVHYAAAASETERQ